MTWALTAADGGDDFDSIPGLDKSFGMPAARHDLAVPFDRDAFALERQLAHQVGNPGRGRSAEVRCAVERDRDHCRWDHDYGVQIITLTWPRRRRDPKLPGCKASGIAATNLGSGLRRNDNYARGRRLRRNETLLRRLLAIMPDRLAEDGELPLKAPAGFAPRQMQPDEPTPPARQGAVLHLRDQAARVLARDQRAQLAWRGRICQPARGVAANQCCSRHCLSAILAR